MTEYKINLSAIGNNESLGDASKEELRVLIALIAFGGKFESADSLAIAAMTSRARASAAIVFWQEAGFITPIDADTDENIFDEFLPREELDAPIAEGSEKIAGHIRDRGLAYLLSECARLLGKPMLATEETKKIVTLSTQYSLSEEFIITLAAYLLEQKKLSVTRLATDAQRLVKKGIDCVEELEKYIEQTKNETSAHWEYKHLIGNPPRSLTQTEKELAQKWFSDYGYSDKIVGLAYSISLDSTGKIAPKYMDTLIRRWYEAGCKTYEQCLALVESDSAALRAQHEKKKNSPPQKKKPAPRYGDFDVNDAFSKALSRSYGDDESENG